MEAMRAEIKELENHGTWLVMKRTELPESQRSANNMGPEDKEIPGRKSLEVQGSVLRERRQTSGRR